MNVDRTGANQEMRSETIILGEDDPEVRNYLAMALKCQGYGVELAQDGEEVMRTLEERKSEVSAILLDLIMPRKDGMETLKEIRRTDSVLPVIIVSGVSSPLSVVEAMKQGATDFIPKPVTPSTVCSDRWAGPRPR
jgi:DNA-binding NtrC family response regulator